MHSGLRIVGHALYASAWSGCEQQKRKAELLSVEHLDNLHTMPRLSDPTANSAQRSSCCHLLTTGSPLLLPHDPSFLPPWPSVSLPLPLILSSLALPCACLRVHALLVSGQCLWPMHA